MGLLNQIEKKVTAVRNTIEEITHAVEQGVTEPSLQDQLEQAQNALAEQREAYNALKRKSEAKIELLSRERDDLREDLKDVREIAASAQERLGVEKQRTAALRHTLSTQEQETSTRIGQLANTAATQKVALEQSEKEMSTLRTDAARVICEAITAERETTKKAFTDLVTEVTDAMDQENKKQPFIFRRTKLTDSLADIVIKKIGDARQNVAPVPALDYQTAPLPQGVVDFIAASAAKPVPSPTRPAEEAPKASVSTPEAA